MSSAADRQVGRFALISLGCPKNLVDSEVLAGLLEAEGHRLVARAEEADFVVVNTCSFVQAARDESTQVIEEMLQLKRRGVLRGVIVAGCLPQRDRESLLERYPEIDALVGVFAREAIVQAAAGVLDTAAPRRWWFEPVSLQIGSEALRHRLTLPHVAYLKISEGCSRRCSFCTIPQIRGPMRSKPLELLVDEARRLADQGVRELVLVAQDTSSYGQDLYGRPRLAELLKRLDRIESLCWIRLMYLYPRNLGDELIEVLAGARRIVPYLDLPLQHISDRILRAMRRGVRRVQIERLLRRLRERIDRLVIRTTLMTGFPGETEGDFDELVRFVDQQRFERLGVFSWSCEPDTPAADLPEHVPERVRQARRNRLLEVQQPIAFEFARRQVGRRLEVMLDAALPEQPGVFVGRSWADAPEIDPVVYVTLGDSDESAAGSDGREAEAAMKSRRERRSGQAPGKVSARAGSDHRPAENPYLGRILACEIVAARGYDLIGVAPASDTARRGRPVAYP